MAGHKKITRRQALGVALAGGTAATLGDATHAETVNAQTAWGLEADIVCVGSGAASVIVLEKSAVSGRHHSQIRCSGLDTQPFWFEGEGDL